MNRQFINPASVGTRGPLRASLAYRTQWTTIASPFKSIAASMEFKPSSRNQTSGFAYGLNIWSQDFGEPSFKILNLEGIVNYKLSLTQSSNLAVGLSTSFDQRSFNTQGGEWGSQFNGFFYDPGIPSGESFPSDSESSLEIGAGAEYTIDFQSGSRKKKSGNRLTLGAAVKHAGRMSLSESQYLSNELNSRYDIYALAEFSIGKMSAIAPAFFSHFQGGSSRILPGVFYKQILVTGTSFIYDVKESALYIGAFYEVNRALIAQAYVEWGQYQLGLAYEFDLSDYKEYSSGRRAFELNFAYRWNRNKRK